MIKIFLLSAFATFLLNVYSQKSTFLVDAAIDQFEHKNVDSAMTLLQRAQKEDSTFFEIYYNRGVMFRELGQSEKAIEEFSKAIQFNNLDTSSYMNRGILYVQKGKTDKALDDFNSVKKLDPRNKEAYFNIGQISAKEGNLQSAEEMFSKAIGIDRDYDSAHFGLAKTYFNTQRFDEAYSHLNTCISLNNHNFLYFELRGIMNLMKGDKEKACSDLKSATDLGCRDERTLGIFARECK